MTEKNNINANERIDESGRSMIEMLGTLAIIGVLSIGGVSGYGRAINAYRANTIVDAAQKKALMTSHELTTGSTVTPDINGAMKTPSGYQVTESTSTGTTGDITPDTKYFGVEVGDTTNGGKAVPVEVAKNLLDKALDSWKYVYGFGVKSADGTGNVSWVTKSGSGTGGIDDAIGNNQTVIIILVYAADLSLRPGELLDGAQFTTGSQGGNTGCTVGSVDGLGGPTGQYDGSDACKCPNEGEVYTSEGCENISEDCPSGLTKNSQGKCECTDHTTNQCGLGYYCQFNPSDCGDSDRGNGVCTAITGGDDSSGHWVGPILDWWSANSWCIGKGRSGLITYSTLQSAYGCNKSSYSCNWSALSADGLSDSYWSADHNSCYAWDVGVLDIDFGDDHYRNDDYNGLSALCE